MIILDVYQLFGIIQNVSKWDDCGMSAFGLPEVNTDFSLNAIEMTANAPFSVIPAINIVYQNLSFNGLELWTETGPLRSSSPPYFETHLESVQSIF